MVEDFTVFFNAAEHATDALLDGVAVTGIFEHGYAQQLSGISTTEPTFALASSAAAGATAASVLVINGGATYRVRSVQADGTGVTLLVLELQ